MRQHPQHPTQLEIAFIAALVMLMLYALAVLAMMQFQIRCGALCGSDAFLFILKGFAR